MQEYLGSLQEKILCLLCFDKDSSCFLSQITPELFSSKVNRDIAVKALTFWKEYKSPPLLHITELLADRIKSKDAVESETYTKSILGLYAIKDDVNRDFVLNQLGTFIRQQELKRDVMEAFDCLQIGNLKGAEKLLFEKKRVKNERFSAGLFPLTDVRELLDEDALIDCIYLGIPYLDNLKICPTKKELFTMLARSGGGKSLLLTHIAKLTLVQRKKVLYISLELSEVRAARRILQALFGIAANKLEVEDSSILIKDDRGGLIDIFSTKINVKDFRDANLIKDIDPILSKLEPNHLIIKEFPSGQLTIDMLKGYLDYLEYSLNYIPDVMLVDYPDLMFLDKDSIRIDTSRTYVELRGIAVERNIAVVAVTQTNRVAEDVTLITRKHIAEDFSKIHISDNLLTYNQTACEQKKNLARLYVDKGRNSKQGGIVLITQNYSIGQFCLDSIKMDADSTNVVERVTR